MKNFVNFFANFVVKRRWWILFAMIPIMFGLLNGMKYLSMDTDIRVFFDKKNPELKALDAFENIYTKDENVFFAIVPKNGNVFTSEILRAVEELTQKAWRIPYSNRVNSITNFQYTYVDGDDLLVENLVQDAQSLSKEDIEKIKKIVLSEILLVNNLISPSGNITGVNVSVILPGKVNNEYEVVTNFARNLLKEILEKYPNIKIYLTGNVVMNYAFEEISNKDISTLIPLMFLILLVFIMWFLRSFTGMIATFLVILFSMLTGLSFAGWFKIPLTVVSINTPTLILTLAVSDSIHLLLSMFNKMRQGVSKYEAIIESMKINLSPIFLTSFTTAVGFLTMNFSNSPPFRDFGNIVAMGVISAFIYSVLFLPSFMAILPIRIKQKKLNKSTKYDKLSHFIINKNKEIFYIILFIILLSIVGVSRIDLNDHPVKYFSKSLTFRQHTDFVTENLRGGDVIEYSLESGEPGGIANPAYLEIVEKFADWYRKQPNVEHVSVITDTIKRLNKTMNADDEEYYRIPKSRKLAAQYLFLYELSLPFGFDLNNIINVSQSSTRMTVILKNIGTREYVNIDKQAHEWLKKNAPKSMFTYGTGISMVWAHITQRNIKSMVSALILAIIGIFLMIIIGLRNFKLGLLSIIPNILPAFIGFGVWGFLFGEVGLSLSVIVSMTLGIVVDDTIHFLSKYIYAKREFDMDTKEAIKYAFNTVGRAMLITSVVLVAGFLVLTFSKYGVNYDMGLMSAIIITFALIIDYFLLPILLLKLEGNRNEKV